MFEIIKTRIQQKYRTMAYPDGPAPELPQRFVGRPILAADRCTPDCRLCLDVCPTAAISKDPHSNALAIDTGRCLFCLACQNACQNHAINFTREYRLAAANRQDLVVRNGSPGFAPARNETAARIYHHSFKLRQVSAGGCNACEADANVLGTLAWDMGRFGIQFVASPRHADALLVTGPVPENMRLALKKTYDALPAPKVVIAVGACAISGGAYLDHPEQHNGASSVIPVDVFIPGCPPHPLTILDGLLRCLGRI